ncbi:MAG: hypothetical protein WC376_04005 [Candidatus Nanoarchaeia archaeon]|jgi:predicted transcriptional regulator of viral defense system
MKELEIIESIKDKPIFSIQTIQRIGNFSKEYSKLIINRLIKRKSIKRVGKNKYTTNNDIFVIASNIHTPSYISFWSASYYYGFSEQILSTIFVASSKKFKEIAFEGYIIKFLPANIFGYKKIVSNNGEIFIAEHEKLIIDIFKHYKAIGNFDEIEKIFKKSLINKKKIIDYLKITNENSTIKRVGFMLEKYKQIDIHGYFNLDSNYCNLNPFSKKYNTLNSKWRLKI